MSAVVDALLARTGLAPVDAARAAGDLERVRSFEALLREVDLLALGALADRVRARECGDEVRLYADRSAPGGDRVYTPPAGLAGMALLRDVAIARITRPRGTHVRLDWNQVGLEISQVALGFGADEHVGRLRAPKTKKGLPLANGQQLRRDELAALVGHTQRKAVFVDVEERNDEHVAG